MAIDFTLPTAMLLKALLSSAFASSALALLPFRFLETFLNRREELNAEGKQLKYDIVCMLVDTKSQHFPAETLMRLKLYRREGPFYVEMVPQLDMVNN